ncbi:MAG: tetratricopeptide repeat protein, partial [Anaerolineae bacterium]|nr:tetratricopeptide repeat protein [Anaerolineae bacterium]
GGESGIGKSRLLEELRTIALVDGWRVLRGQSSADLRLPYQVWRAPARSLIIGAQLDDLQAAVLRSLAPDIETLIERAVTSAADLQGAAYVQRLASTLAGLLRDAAAPVLLILEDLHWAGDDLDLLRQVTASLTASPVLIVGSYRSDERPDLPTAFPSAQNLFLNRLPTPQIDALAESMLGAGGHSPALIELLERETEGNILFIIEVIRALAEEAGELRRIPQERLPARVFAGGILEAVLRRLRRLPDWAAQLLNVAALAGRDLDLTLLRALMTPAFDLDAWLTACANAAVLEPADQRWRFSHDKLREALIARLPDNQFRLLHAQIAEGIQQVYPNDDQYAEALFEHLLAANEPDRAIPHGQVAARAALASSRYGDTRRIVDAVKALAGDSLETVGFDLFAAEAALYQGDYSRADALCQAVLSRLPSREEATGGDARRARALLLRARLFTVKGDYQRAAPTFQDALDQAKLADDQRGIADALFGLGQIEERQAEGERAGAHYAQCLAIYRALDDAAGIADSLHGMGGVAYTSGDHESARRAYEESLAMRRKIGDRRAIASSLNNLGGVLDAQGKKDEARQRFAESLNLRREIGERRGIAMSLLNLGHLLEDQGDLESAFAHFSESYELFRGLGVKQGIAISLINLASTWRLRGAHARARGLLDEALALVREMGDSLMIAHCLNGLALAALALGETPAALAVSDEEIDLRRELGDAHLLGMALWTRAEILLSAERQRDSNAALREALQLGLDGGFADLLLRALKTQAVRGEDDSLIAILRANRALADLETRRWIDALPDPPSPTEAVPDLVEAARRLVEKLDRASG